LGHDTELAGPAQVYARRVGQRLRSIRRQKKLSLQEVEASSAAEFKASVLGAYERGERVISVPRLQRLAGFYSVPVDQLLPPDENAADGQPASSNGPTNGSDPSARRQAVRAGKVTFDLSRFGDMGNDHQLAMVQRYLASIQVQRQDFNGRVLTIRGDDIRAMAGLFGTDSDSLLERLDRVRLRLTPT